MGPMINFDQTAAHLINLTDQPPTEFEAACALLTVMVGEPSNWDWRTVVLDALSDNDNNYAIATAQVAAELREAA
jgi:hypothetical protein